MSSPTCPQQRTLTMAAAQLLLAARSAGRMSYSGADAEVLLHPSLRYSHRGADAVSVCPITAVEELLSAGLAVGTVGEWGLT